MFKPIIKGIKWLIFTNLYIGIAAVCFQAIIYYLNFEEDWSWVLTIHTFFSTCLVYQFSRWNFHKNYKVSEEAKSDEIYQFIENHQSGVRNSIIISALGVFVTCFMLQRNTLIFLGLLGCVSLFYPLKYKGIAIRKIPYLKVFLIAIVWASIAVWMPFFEVQPDYQVQDYLLYFVFCVVYILFITIPFDKVDLAIDQMTNVKTIPALLGERGSNVLLTMFAIALLIMGWFVLPNLLSFVLISLLIFGLLGVSVFALNRLDKWMVMAIYDGSMIVFFLIVMLAYG